MLIQKIILRKRPKISTDRHLQPQNSKMKLIKCDKLCIDKAKDPI